jgi:L-aspartate oxidase
VKSTDYLIIGSGAAGLSLAIKLADHFPNRKITVITKSTPQESNTKYAQGGLAVVFDKDNDSFEKHINDTLMAGDGLCDKNVVKMVVTQAPDCIKELMSWGVDLDTNNDGNLDLGIEGGHSEKRVVHHKDTTGNEIERRLHAKAETLANLHFLSEFFVVDLLAEGSKQQRTCCGVLVFDEKRKEYHTLHANYTCIATGGSGQVYEQSTNPVIATGDGLAMAFRAGASIKNMEFVQFHPTAVKFGDGPAFLISEAVRGYGAYLRNERGERFTFEHDPHGEMASRDIVARAIDLEIRKNKSSNVYLDCTHLDKTSFEAKFPNINKVCSHNGYNLNKDWIPISPAAHYQSGGIVVNTNGQTNLENLYACGECTYTGLHGANRLASNAILEALVYSNNIYKKLASLQVHGLELVEPQSFASPKDFSSKMTVQMRESLQKLMSNHVGIVRSKKGLEKARITILQMQKEYEKIIPPYPASREELELKNLLDVAQIIVVQSLKRRTNKGGYYNLDLDLKNPVLH